MTSDTEGF